jgi:hypothetical protein
MQCVTESQVQAQILELLAAYRVDAVPIDAGGRRQRGRMMVAAKSWGLDIGRVINVKTGGAIPKGFADLEATLAPKGRSLYIEVKAPRWINADGSLVRQAGKPSDEQLAFLMSKHVRGALVMVAWSSMEVAAHLAEALLENKKALH